MELFQDKSEIYLAYCASRFSSSKYLIIVYLNTYFTLFMSFRNPDFKAISFILPVFFSSKPYLIGLLNSCERHLLINLF